MKKKILFSPLLIIVLFIVLGVGIAGAAIYFGGTGTTGDINLQKGLIGWWKMDGNAKDSTANLNHGTVTGTTPTTDRKGQANKAYSFSGTSSYIDIPNKTSLRIGGNFSLELWFKVSTWVDYNDLVSQYQTPGWLTTTGFKTDIFSNKRVRFILNPGAGEVGAEASGLSDNQWYYLVVTVDGSKLRLYIDGILRASPNAGSMNSSAGNIRMGIYEYTGGAYAMDNVRIYNRALSATEVTALYSSYDAGIVISDLQKGLMGQWKFDGNAKDSTANVNHGTVSGATLTTDRKGQANKACNFNGASDYIQISDSGSLDMSGGITLAAWINLGETPGANLRTIFAKDGTWSRTSTNYQLDIRNSGKIEFAYRGSDGSANQYITNSVVITSGSTWYHVVLAYDGANNPTIYVNGIAQAGAYPEGGNKTLIGNSQPLFIGVLGNAGVVNNNYFIGKLDDVRAYNRALSAAEVLALYQDY